MLAGLCEPLLVRLVNALRVVDFIPGQLILEKGEYSEGIKWIWTGTYEVLDDEGKWPVATVVEGMMLGENCLLKDAPKNTCSIRAMTWCNALMLAMSDVGEVFKGYDQDMHWLMCFAQVRWPRFCASVALSMVLELASRMQQPLRGWIKEMAECDEQFVDQVLIEIKVREGRKEMAAKAAIKMHAAGAVSLLSSNLHKESPAKATPLPTPTPLPTSPSPGATSILKKSGAAAAKKSIVVFGEDFGKRGELSRDSMRVGGSTSTGALSDCQAPLVVHGADMGFGGAAGGRRPSTNEMSTNTIPIMVPNTKHGKAAVSLNIDDSWNVDADEDDDVDVVAFDHDLDDDV